MILQTISIRTHSTNKNRKWIIKLFTGKGPSISEVNKHVKSEDVEASLAADKDVNGHVVKGLSQAEVQQMKNTIKQINKLVAKEHGQAEPS